MDHGRGRGRGRGRGVPTLRFEMSTCYLNASWWMVDPRMAGVWDERKLLEDLLVDGGLVQGKTLVSKACLRAYSDV